METKVLITDAVIDNTEVFIESIESHSSMEILIFPSERDPDDGNDVIPCIGMWIQDRDEDKPSTLMFDLSKTDALFLGKSLIAMAESLKENDPES